MISDRAYRPGVAKSISDEPKHRVGTVLIKNRNNFERPQLDKLRSFRELRFLGAKLFPR